MFVLFNNISGYKENVIYFIVFDLREIVSFSLFLGKALQ